MLKHLKIKNIALIKELTINFERGLNVLTGETGAGKSIIIDSLNFVLGEKVNKNLMRSGESFMSVEALFVQVSDNVKNVLSELGIAEDDDIVITRTYSESSGSIKLNGTTLTAGMLKTITPYLVDIHGQHEHQSLLKSKFHLGIIDNLNISKTAPAKADLEVTLKEYKDTQKQIEELGSSGENRERMMDLLNYQINEIERFKLRENEDAELTNKRNMMLNSGKIAGSLNNAVSELDGGASVVSAIKKAMSSLNAVSQYDPGLNDVITRLDSVKLELDDVIDELKVKCESVDFDDREFDKIDSRLDDIKALKKKYGSSVADIMQFLQKAKTELERYHNSGELLAKLTKQKEQLFDVLFDKAAVLSEIRKAIAKDFEEKVVRELNELGMKNARFAVKFNEATKESVSITAGGYDDVCFMFSANLGQPLKPLSDIISGGEMSRFMLGVKNILAEIDEINTLVFDEIDTGISGAIGFVIACKFANIAKNHQIISVSHLPQIAAMADCHLFIEKSTEETTTVTNVKMLDDTGSLREVARLSGGEDSSTATMEHAKELKARCNNYKADIR